MHFGASLRLVRVAAGLGLRDLAATIGVSPAYLSRVEHGHDPPPTPDRLVALARALAVSPGLLLDLAGVARPASFAARGLHDEVVRRGLTPAQIARVLDFMDRTFPMAGEARPLVGPEDVLRGVRVATAADAVDVATSRLRVPSEVRAAFRRVSLEGAAVGGGLIVPHVEEGPPAASLVLLDRRVPGETPDEVPVGAVLALTGVGETGRGVLVRAARLGDEAVLAAAREAGDLQAACEVLRLAERPWR